MKNYNKIEWLVFTAYGVAGFILLATLPAWILALSIVVIMAYFILK